MTWTKPSNINHTNLMEQTTWTKQSITHQMLQNLSSECYEIPLNGALRWHEMNRYSTRTARLQQKIQTNPRGLHGRIPRGAAMDNLEAKLILQDELPVSKSNLSTECNWIQLQWARNNTLVRNHSRNNSFELQDHSISRQVKRKSATPPNPSSQELRSWGRPGWHWVAVGVGHCEQILKMDGMGGISNYLVADHGTWSYSVANNGFSCKKMKMEFNASLTCMSILHVYVFNTNCWFWATS